MCVIKSCADTSLSLIRKFPPLQDSKNWEGSVLMAVQEYETATISVIRFDYGTHYGNKCANCMRGPDIVTQTHTG